MCGQQLLRRPPRPRSHRRRPHGHRGRTDSGPIGSGRWDRILRAHSQRTHSDTTRRRMSVLPDILRSAPRIFCRRSYQDTARNGRCIETTPRFQPRWPPNLRPLRRQNPKCTVRSHSGSQCQRLCTNPFRRRPPPRGSPKTTPLRPRCTTPCRHKTRSNRRRLGPGSAP